MLPSLSGLTLNEKTGMVCDEVAEPKPDWFDPARDEDKVTRWMESFPDENVDFEQSQSWLDSRLLSALAWALYDTNFSESWVAVCIKKAPIRHVVSFRAWDARSRIKQRRVLPGRDARTIVPMSSVLEPQRPPTVEEELDSDYVTVYTIGAAITRTKGPMILMNLMARGYSAFVNSPVGPFGFGADVPVEFFPRPEHRPKNATFERQLQVLTGFKKITQITPLMLAIATWRPWALCVLLQQGADREQDVVDNATGQTVSARSLLELIRRNVYAEPVIADFDAFFENWKRESAAYANTLKRGEGGQGAVFVGAGQDKFDRRPQPLGADARVGFDEILIMLDAYNRQDRMLDQTGTVLIPKLHTHVLYNDVAALKAELQAPRTDETGATIRVEVFVNRAVGPLRGPFASFRLTEPYFPNRTLPSYRVHPNGLADENGFFSGVPEACISAIMRGVQGEVRAINPLHLAVLLQNKPIVKLLLSIGASPTSQMQGMAASAIDLATRINKNLQQNFRPGVAAGFDNVDPVISMQILRMLQAKAMTDRRRLAKMARD